jgi:hypothetical protein
MIDQNELRGCDKNNMKSERQGCKRRGKIYVLATDREDKVLIDGEVKLIISFYN